MRRLLPLAACAATLATVPVADASTRSDRSAARQVAQQYLDAIAHHQPRVICRLLTPTALEDLLSTEPEGTSCVTAAGRIPRALGRYPIVAVHVQGRQAVAVIGDAEISDSGDDNLPLVKRHGRWLLDGV